MKSKKKILIIGGGFAGIKLAAKLDERLFDVILIDKINHHQFQPLFYQVATSQLEPSSISFPLRYIFNKKRNIQIRLAEVISIDEKKNTIHTVIGPFEYHFLILAIGCKTNFYGNENIKNHALVLKTTYDAIAIRNHILQTFEKIVSANELEREGLFNLVIVGAGPTGVELAGAFAEIKNNILPLDFRDVDFTMLKIILIEGSSETLNSMSFHAKKASGKYLKKMGVEIKTETFVENYDGQVLYLNNNQQIKSRTVIWTAGVTGNRIGGLPDHYYATNNRIRVNRYNLVTGSENIFAIGDIAYMETPLYLKGHPQVANVAINQAKNLAKNLKHIINGTSPIEFEYRDMGSMATIGRNKAVVDLPFIQFKGYFAWLTWMLLHLMLILSVRNKLIIFINWAWAYITKNTALRLILKQENS